MLTKEGELHYVINQLEEFQIFASVASFVKWKETEKYDNDVIFFSKKEMCTYNYVHMKVLVSHFMK